MKHPASGRWNAPPIVRMPRDYLAGACSSTQRFSEIVAVNWYALLAPAGTPRAIVERLNAEGVKVMNTPETRPSLSAMGGEPASATPEQTGKFLQAEYARWGKVIREAGIKAE